MILDPIKVIKGEILWPIYVGGYAEFENQRRAQTQRKSM